MNPEPKAVIHARLKAINMTQTQLATQLWITPALLESTLSAPMIPSGDHLLAILDALDLEVVIRSKQD